MRNGQASFEFLLVTAIAITLLVTSTYFIFGYTQAGADRTALVQAAQIGYQIVDNARNVYLYGEGSFLTILANQNEQIQGVYVVENQWLVIDVRTDKGIIPVNIYSDIPINGTMIDADFPLGERTMVQDPFFARGGRASYRVQSEGTWVRINQI